MHFKAQFLPMSSSTSANSTEVPSSVTVPSTSTATESSTGNKNSSTSLASSKQDGTDYSSAKSSSNTTTTSNPSGATTSASNSVTTTTLSTSSVIVATSSATAAVSTTTQTSSTSTPLPGSSALGSALGVNVSSMATKPTRPTMIIDVKMPLQGVYDPNTIKKSKKKKSKKDSKSKGKSGAGDDNADTGNEYEQSDNDTFDSDVPEMNPFENVVVDFMRLAEKKYGYDKVHPYAAQNALDLARGDLNDMDDDDEDGVILVDGTNSDKEGPTNVNTNNKKANAAANRAKIEGKYDLNDPFIDDSEMLWEEQAVSTKDGFFVYSGPLEEDEDQNDTNNEASGNSGNSNNSNSNNTLGGDDDKNINSESGKHDDEQPHGTKRSRSTTETSTAGSGKTPKAKKANRKSDTKKSSAAVAEK